MSRVRASNFGADQRRPAPDRRATQPLGVRVDSPERAQVPVQALADGFEDLQRWPGLVSRPRPGRGSSHTAPSSLRSDFLRRVMSWKTTTPPCSPPCSSRRRAAGDQDPGTVIAAGIGDVELGLVARLATDRPHQGKIIDRVRGQPIRQEDLVKTRPLLGGHRSARGPRSARRPG